MDKKWYVFDEFDCFGDYPNVEDAAKQAEYLATTAELGGVEIRHFTKGEFNAYCEGGAPALDKHRNPAS